MNLAILGLIFDIMGVFIIIFTEIANPHYGKIYGQPLRKTYWWNGWRPLYKNTETKKWVLKWRHKQTIHGAIPPKYKIEIIGIVFILLGFLLQIVFYLN